jgi:Tfp pilus assembly protein PilF
VLARRGEVQLAVQQLSVLLQGQPFDTASYLLRAQFQQVLGAHAEAVRDARRALLTDPSSVYAHVLIAFSALSTGRSSLARCSIRSGQRLLQAASGGPPTAFSDDLTRDDMSNLLATLARTMSQPEARDS